MSSEDRPLSRVFNVVIGAATLISFGWQLLTGSHPIWGIILVVSGVFYLLYKANTSEWATANVDGMLRFVFTVLVACAIVGFYYHNIASFFVQNKGSQASEPETVASPSPSQPPPQASHAERPPLVREHAIATTIPFEIDQTAKIVVGARVPYADHAIMMRDDPLFHTYADLAGLGGYATDY